MQLFHGTENESFMSLVFRDAEHESETDARKGVQGQIIMPVYFTVRNYSQHHIALHDIADYFDNKRSVSEIICGAEHEFVTAKRRLLSWVKMQGCWYTSSEWCIVCSAFYSPFM